MATIKQGTARKTVLFKAGTTAFMKAEGEAYRKDFIREGNWRLPSGKEFPVNKKRIDVWEGAFKLFRQRGISVPLTVDHIQVTDENGQQVIKKLTPAMAEAKRGEVVNLFRSDNLGMFDAKPADEDARVLMGRCPEVSLEVEEDVFDSEGNYYPEAITAITLTPIPVIPGQQGWEKVHLNKDATGNTVYFSAEPITSTEATQPPVQENRTMFTKEQLSRAKTSLGLVDSTPDIEVEVAMLGHIEANSASKLTTLSRENAELRVSQGAQQLDEEAAEALIASYENRVKDLKSITPAQRTILSKVINAQKQARRAVFLSRKVAEKNGLDKAVMDTVISIFEAGKPEEMAALLKEVSGQQKRTELSKAGSGHSDEPEHDPDLTKKMTDRLNAQQSGTGANTVL